MKNIIGYKLELVDNFSNKFPTVGYVADILNYCTYQPKPGKLFKFLQSIFN